jgi:hypothetical protein
MEIPPGSNIINAVHHWFITSEVRISPKAIHMEFVVEKEEWGQIFNILWFFYQSSLSFMFLYCCSTTVLLTCW